MSGSKRIAMWTLPGLLSLLLLTGCPSTPVDSGNQAAAVTETDPPADNTVELNVNEGPKPRKDTLSRTSEESVVWKNNDDRGHTIRFTDWPFREAQQEIHVEAGKKSAVFHVYKNQDHGPYPYGIFPPIPGDPGSTGPPDPPAFEVGD